MAGTDMKNAVVIGLILVVAIYVIFQYDPTLFGIFRQSEGFETMNGKQAMGLKVANGSTQKSATGSPAVGQTNNGMKAQKDANVGAAGTTPAGMKAVKDSEQKSGSTLGQGLKEQPKVEKFEDLAGYEGPAQFGSVEPPAGCYPRDQLTPSELLPKDMSSIWAEQNPMGPGSLKGKNFLSAGALIGVNTVGQSLRNANLQIRSEPPNPQIPVSIFNQSTITPDISHRPLEVGS